MISESLPWQWWGADLPYGVVLERQNALREEVLRGETSECLGLLEHREVITTGRRAVDNLPSVEVLRAQGIDFHQTRRGGLATWHGPGQLVGYLICSVAERNWTVRATVAGIEEGLMAWLETQGVQADRRCGHPGVWIGPRKIGSVGLHFRKGVSMHGFALNLQPVGSGASMIEPCGMPKGVLTSLQEQTGRVCSPCTAAPSVGRHVVAALCGWPSS